MIVLLHPRSTRPKNRRFPLSVLALAAVLEGREAYRIVDANIDPDPLASLDAIGSIELLAVSVMPGPQMVDAVRLCRAFRERHPKVPIVWGGYFPTLYPEATLNCSYIDFAVRGQGEETLLELLAALRLERPVRGIQGLSHRDGFGLYVHNPDRAIRSPGDFPELPYHRLRHPEQYIARTFLGERTAVHHASFGCPYRCRFCAVPEMSGARQKSESPERTAAVLTHLQKTYGIDSVQFYDNNFFLREADALKLAQLLEPLHLKWWCEARVDILLRYSDATLHALRQAGCSMIFFGAESGDDAVLAEMNKQLTAQQILDLAARLRPIGIIPEFSFVIGNPRNPQSDAHRTERFIRRIKAINPASEIIVQHYVPTPHPDGLYGEVEAQIEFPRTPDEWATERWYNFTVRRDTAVPWLPSETKRFIDGFETVLSCRWPTVQDILLSPAARALLRIMSAWRYALRCYAYPVELQWLQRVLKPRRPKMESL